MEVTKAAILKTERLVLRPIELEDAPNLTYLLHPEILKDAGPYMPRSLEDLPVHVERIRSSTSWLITLQERVIGDIGVFSCADGVGEIAYYLAPEHWQKGYAAEAGEAVISHMFDELNFREITAPIDQKNTASRRLIEKLGFQLESMERDADLYGKKADVCLYVLKNVKQQGE